MPPQGSLNPVSFPAPPPTSRLRRLDSSVRPKTLSPRVLEKDCPVWQLPGVCVSDVVDEGSARATGDEATPTPRMPLLPPPRWFEMPSCPVWGQRPTCPPRPSEGSGRAYTPQRTARAPWKLAVASGARLS